MVTTEAKSTISLNEMPEYQIDHICFTLPGIIKRAYEDPEYRKAFEEWKKEHRRTHQ